MKARFVKAGLMAAFMAVLAVSVWAGGFLESLQPNQKVHGFTVTTLYDNSSGKAMGARFVSDKYGFILDLMQIQSVPQAFYWIKTMPTSSKGEPHACEHLLLGKGNRGRYVAALEDMSLGQSTAFTAQTRTCYHFNTVAGEETFYKLFEAKLMAFLDPNFTDEEIRREVCHIGVVENPENDSLYLDEKGTVYTEMVSSFEKPWYYSNIAINEMVYGKDHPLTYISGGDPDVMREMTAEDMWKFIKATHHLANMGAIVSIPEEIDIDRCLARMDEILNRCQAKPTKSKTTGIGKFDFPKTTPAPVGSVRMVTYPSERAEDPGYVNFTWPADLKIEPNERFLLELFLNAFANGETSNLYNLFINSQTRKIDFGGQYSYGGVDDDMDISIYFGLVGINNQHVTEAGLDTVRAILLDELNRLASLPDGSEELAAFNKEVSGKLIQSRKQIDNYLNSPPMFGFRSGPAGGWVTFLRNLEEEPGFRKSLALKNRFAFVESLLAQNNNFWKDYITGWRLLEIPPYAVGATPSPDILAKAAQAKQARLAGYVENFKKKYNIKDDQAALRKYKEEFDAKTAELETLASKDKLPGFMDNPPMTVDDQLEYEMMTLPGNIPLVASTFDNMTASKIGLALRLDAIPESLLIYVPFLPSILTDMGVTRDGEIIPYDRMEQRLREEVLNFNAYFDYGYETGRAELVLAGQGSNLEELKNSLGWMEAALYAPYLSPDNLPRINDVINQSLLSLRNRTKSPEEYWVDNPSNAYRMQHNPLFLAAGSFLTSTHLHHRLKWQLTDPGNSAEQKELSDYLETLKDYGKGKTRAEIEAMLTLIEGLDQLQSESMIGDLKPNPMKFQDKVRKVAQDIAVSLKQTLSDIPDANLEGDWVYLCNEIKADLMMLPETSLARMNEALNLIRKSDNARMFMISNSADRQATMDMINSFVGKLDKNPSVRQTYASDERIDNRLKSRAPGLERPAYVGLMHDGTRNGVMIFSAKIADHYDTTTSAVLNCLSGKLFGGGGPHGLFMKTWAAGLAYSNGYSYNQTTGRVSYYAERCPDVAETMRFVVNTLKEAQPDTGLADYAIAQVFDYSRAPSRYEDRGEAMARDLTDGFTPEKVRAFRQKVLEMKKDPDLFNKIWSRMEEAYGPVLIGYGKPSTESREGRFFLIGPDPQFQTLEKLIESAEGKQTVQRLYPRDFWLTM